MVILGGGKAGARAIVGLRGYGWEGSITLINAENLMPYDRPPLSKAAITDEAEPLPTSLLDLDMMTSLNVNHMRHTSAIDINRGSQTITLSNGSKVLYHRLLLATGAAPRKIPLEGGERALTLRDFADARKIRHAFATGKSVAIIGGGFIGLELAASATKYGCKVTVIESQPRILMRGVPDEIAGHVAARHASAGVTILTEVSVVQINPLSVVLTDDREIDAEILIAGIGAAPRTALAQKAGLAIDNGIACDTKMQTSDPFIWAAGDCCSFPHPIFDNMRMRLESWRNASDQAVTAVENMMGASRDFTAVPWFWSDQYDLSLQIAGVPGLGLSTVRRNLRDGAFIVCHINADGRLVGASGIGRGNTIARDIRLLELLIGKKARPSAVQLSDANFQLKSLIKTDIAA